MMSDPFGDREWVQLIGPDAHTRMWNCVLPSYGGAGRPADLIVIHVDRIDVRQAADGGIAYVCVYPSRGGSPQYMVPGAGLVIGPPIDSEGGPG